MTKNEIFRDSVCLRYGLLGNIKITWDEKIVNRVICNGLLGNHAGLTVRI